MPILFRCATVKVVFYLPTPGGLTGAPRRLLALCRSLSSYGVSSCVATEPHSELSTRAIQDGHDVVDVDTQGILALRHGALLQGGIIFKVQAALALAFQNLRFWAVVRSVNAEAVWIRGSKGIGFAGLGAFLSSRPLVWDVDYEPPSKGIVRCLHRLGLWCARTVVFQYSAAPSEIFGPALAKRYRHKFRTVIPGVDLVSLQGAAGERVLHGGQKRCFTILCVGTICDRKNQQLLIDALTAMKQKAPEVEYSCLFAGRVFEQDYAVTLREKLREDALESAVQFLGWREDVHALMAAADLLVMPSKDEGVPNTVQEAMAIGLPVIVSAAGGMPEIVRDGETGWVLPLGAPEKWASKILQCVEDSAMCERVSVAARAYAWAHFGTMVWSQEYAEILRSAVSED